MLFICLLPALLTQLPFCILDFSGTGQVGDTIGGTMGPFIAIIAALLTFVAFWAQFEANKELIKENRRNHFENRFYKMLDMHLESVNRFKDQKESGDDLVFCKWCNDILNTYNLFMMEAGFNGLLSTIRKSLKDDPNHADYLKFLKLMEDNLTVRSKVMFEITYSILFFNESSSLKDGNGIRSEFVRQFAVQLITCVKEDIGDKKIVTFKPMNEKLGRYYRHLFQIVKFVDGQPKDLYEEDNWKNEYIGLLRSQMSDYEQVLLYYNAQSSLGSAWDENHYIENYKLIKNIPHSEIYGGAGIPPIEKYREAIDEAHSKDISFFENE